MNIFNQIIDEQNAIAEDQADALLNAGVISDDQIEYSFEMDLSMRFLESED